MSQGREFRARPWPILRSRATPSAGGCPIRRSISGVGRNFALRYTVRGNPRISSELGPGRDDMGDMAISIRAYFRPESVGETRLLLIDAGGALRETTARVKRSTRAIECGRSARHHGDTREDRRIGVRDGAIQVVNPPALRWWAFGGNGVEIHSARRRGTFELP